MGVCCLSRIVQGWRRNSGYPSGTRGAQRARLREAYRHLSAEQRERLRYEKELYMLQLELQYLGPSLRTPAPHPVSLSEGQK